MANQSIGGNFFEHGNGYVAMRVGKNNINALMENLWQPVASFLKNNQTLFSGEIKNQIDELNKITECYENAILKNGTSKLNLQG
jgi:hypothetical protein